MSKIEWTNSTWNPTTGCSKISAGCSNCYAESMTRRLQAMGLKKYGEGFDKVRLHHEVLGLPVTWKTPQKVFVNSMSDLFHQDLSLEQIQEVFAVMLECNHHIFQVLTKRAERLEQLSSFLSWPENVWMGVSVENKRAKSRINHLRNTEAKTKFISIEPLIEDLGELDLKEIDWVVVGGESGPGARPVEERWVESVLEQCLACDIPFFFKQWGGKNKKKAPKPLLRGKTWYQWPRIALHNSEAV